MRARLEDIHVLDQTGAPAKLIVFADLVPPGSSENPDAIVPESRTVYTRSGDVCATRDGRRTFQTTTGVTYTRVGPPDASFGHGV